MSRRIQGSVAYLCLCLPHLCASVTYSKPPSPIFHVSHISYLHAGLARAAEEELQHRLGYAVVLAQHAAAHEVEGQLSDERGG